MSSNAYIAAKAYQKAETLIAGDGLCVSRDVLNERMGDVIKIMQSMHSKENELKEKRKPKECARVVK